MGLSILNDLRYEINKRLDRETSYVLKLADILANKESNPNRLEAINLLKDKIEDNNKGLKIINEYISSYVMKNEDDCPKNWEKFVKEKYWDKT